MILKFIKSYLVVILILNFIQPIQSCMATAHEDTASLPVCVVPDGKVGLVVDDGTTLSTLDGSHAQKALGSCDCSVGTKRFYNPARRRIPNDTYTDNQDAFILDSTRGCASLCFCNEARTKCYVGQDANTYVEFSPSCTGGECHVYAVPYTQVFDNIQFNGVKNSATGAAFSSPDPYTVPVSPSSGYIKTGAISCRGCSHIRGTTC